MSIVLAVALASIAHVEASCSWDHPGANRYRGTASAAIDRYPDIPDQVRATLKRRMAENQPDDRVSITRDAITGRNRYAAEIRDMHFGAASLCRTVTRSGWSARRSEPAAVYCVGRHCILVPRICGNVSRITRLESEPEAQPAVHGGAAGAGAGGGAGGAGLPVHGRAGQTGSGAAPQGAWMPVQGEEAGGVAQPSAASSVAPASGQQDAVTVAGAEDEARNRLPGRGADSWTAPYGGWQNPGRDGNRGSAGNPPAPAPAPVPEPATWAMWAGGLGAMWLRMRRQSGRRPRLS